MFSENRNLDDPNNAEISAELEALLSHGHMSHESPFEVDDRSGDHYLFTGNEEDTLLDEDSLPFNVEIEDRRNGTVGRTLLERGGGDGANYSLEEMTGHQEREVRKSLIDDIKEDHGEFHIEKRSPMDYAPGSVYVSPCGTADIDPEHPSHKPFADTTFQVAVNHVEQDGNYLPETADDDDEIATEHLHLDEDVALFGTPPIMDTSHERLIDDETLDRLKEEMKRMDQERNHATMHVAHEAPAQQSNILPPFPTLSSPGHHQQNAFAGPSKYRTSQPGPSLGRSDSLRSTHLNGSPSIGSFLDSDASHLSEASHQQKPPRRRMTDERRDSTGSSGSKHLIPLCEETGKRMIVKNRMDQLARLIRNKMRSAWGVSEDDPLPGPEKGGPDWSKGSKHPDNVKFQEDIAAAVYREIAMDPTHAVPENQRTLEAAKVAANVSFNNFCKRYAYQTDERWKAKSARDAKRGRRWARKDLKQKKRSKAAARLEQPIPQQILRMEYMSSEDSSEGEDSGLAEGTWQFYADMTGRASAEEKVVEVKTPRWRSTQLQGIYDRLDEIAVTQTAETKGRGYTQIPLRRFKLDALRPKNPPRTADSWMFVDGVRPPPLPRKPRRPNDTAKRRAEEASPKPKQAAGETSKRVKDSPQDDDPDSQQRAGAQELTMPTLTSATPEDLQAEAMLDPFDHDQDFGMFDDRPFDTVEENVHYFETENKAFDRHSRPPSVPHETHQHIEASNAHPFPRLP